MKPHVVAAGGGQDYDWSQDHIFIKSAAGLTDGRVTVVEDLLKPGFHLPRHRHRQMVEIFYVLLGQVTFQFDDGAVDARTGMTVVVPVDVVHEVTSRSGARLLTIFTPGGFDHYLAELAAMTPQDLADPDRVRELGERYDIWPE